MSWLDWLLGLTVEAHTRGRGRTRTTRRTWRLTAGPPRQRRQGPGLGWRIGTAISRRMGRPPTCPQCGRPIENESDALCARCGLPVYPLLHPEARGAWQPRQCPKCRRELHPDDQYCPQCRVRSRAQRAAVTTERQMRAQQKAALHVERARAVAEMLGDMGLDPALAGRVPSKTRKPVKVTDYTRPDGVHVGAHTRNKPGEGGTQA